MLACSHDLAREGVQCQVSHAARLNGPTLPNGVDSGYRSVDEHCIAVSDIPRVDTAYPRLEYHGWSNRWRIHQCTNGTYQRGR